MCAVALHERNYIISLILDKRNKFIKIFCISFFFFLWRLRIFGVDSIDSWSYIFLESWNHDLLHRDEIAEYVKQQL